MASRLSSPSNEVGRSPLNDQTLQQTNTPQPSKVQNLFDENVPQSSFSKQDIQRALKSWKKLGLNEVLAKKYPEQVAFLAKSRLLKPVEQFKNTQGGQHGFSESKDGLTILFEGQRVPVSELMSEWAWDENKENLIHTPTNRGGVYVETGLEFRERFGYEKPFSMITLTSDQLKATQEKAAKFFEKYPDPTPHIPKKCVLQLMTAPNPISLNPALEGLNANTALHVGFRLIDEDGTVYSAGDRGVPGVFIDQSQVTSGSNGSGYIGLLAASADSVAAMPDFEENVDGAQGRIVTNVPISKDAFLKQLDQLPGKDWLNLINQNCARKAVNRLEECVPQVKLDAWVPAEIVVARMIPNPFNLPFLKPVKTAFSWLFHQVSRLVHAITPKFIIEAFKAVGSFFYNLVRGVLIAPLMNLALYALGGRLSITQDSKEDVAKRKSPPKAVDGLGGILNPSSSLVYHPQKVVEWMLKVPSTEVYEIRTDHLRFDIVPQEKPTARSEELRRIFTERYVYDSADIAK